MTAAIETMGLTKYYGPARGIENVALQVQTGEIFGFLGPNGAGKTTTIRLLLDLIRPTRGHAYIFGMDVRQRSVEVRRRIGFVSGEPAFFASLSGQEHLALVNSFHGGSGLRRASELAARLDLDLRRPVRSYSHGMRQKLAIIQALAHDPDLLILDEPTSGLDPLVQGEFYHILAEVKDRGKTAFLSSHILSEVERVCDRVGIVRDGALVALLDVADLKRRRVRRMEVTLRREARPEDFQVEGAELVRCEGRWAELRVSGHAAEVVQHIAALPIEDVVFPEATLEDTFMGFYAQEKKP